MHDDLNPGFIITFIRDSGFTLNEMYEFLRDKDFQAVVMDQKTYSQYEQLVLAGHPIGNPMGKRLSDIHRYDGKPIYIWAREA